MMFAVIKLQDDDITVETILPTVEKCNQYIRSLTHITIGNSKKVIQSHIANESEIDMDGYYITLDKVSDRYQILERKTLINSGWIINSITQKCSTIGWLYVREMPTYETPTTTTEKLTQPMQMVLQKKNISNFAKPGKFCSPELMAELIEKLKTRHIKHNPSNPSKVKSD